MKSEWRGKWEHTRNSLAQFAYGVPVLSNAIRSVQRGDAINNFDILYHRLKDKTTDHISGNEMKQAASGRISTNILFGIYVSENDHFDIITVRVNEKGDRKKASEWIHNIGISGLQYNNAANISRDEFEYSVMNFRKITEDVDDKKKLEQIIINITTNAQKQLPNNVRIMERIAEMVGMDSVYFYDFSIDCDRHPKIEPGRKKDAYDDIENLSSLLNYCIDLLSHDQKKLKTLLL